MELQSPLASTRLSTDNKTVPKRTTKDKPSLQNAPKTRPKKDIKRELSPEASSTSERPRTATLRKGSIVNSNIVGPEVPSTITTKPSKVESSHDSNEDNYEDDFDSYESDFEAYSSTEESVDLKKISADETSSTSSSSVGDLSFKAESPTLHTKRVSSASTDEERKFDSGTFEMTDEFKHKQILDNIKESVEKEHGAKVNPNSLSDEGFEDQKSLQFINFADAKKRCDKRRASEARRQRGQEILSMIRLDSVSFTVFDLPSVPYEVFILNYGNSNAVQASVQTGDDDITEETQTDAFEVESKWTQMPAKFSSFDLTQDNFWENYRNEYLGTEDTTALNQGDVSSSRLVSFLSQAADLCLNIISEESRNNTEKISENTREIPFSKGFLELDTSQEVFKDTRVQSVTICPNKIVVVHSKTRDCDDLLRSIVSIWDMCDFSCPRIILVSFGLVLCSTLSLNYPDYIFAGQENGAVVVWNVKDNTRQYGFGGRTPAYSTKVGVGHLSKVVSIQSIEDQRCESEICSLDEDGNIFFWSAYMEPNKNIVLIKGATISLQGVYPDVLDLVCTEFIVVDNHIYVSTNYGFVLHCLVKGSGSKVAKFVPETPMEGTCLEKCPFSASYFLAGYSNGNITLHSRTTERPLMVLRNREEIDSSSVQIIQWSSTKPFVLYAKDSRNCVHIWDLSKSDMFLTFSIPFKKRISCMRLSHVISHEDKGNASMVIGTEDGKIYFHLLSADYGQQSYEDYQGDVKRFLNYASRL